MSNRREFTSLAALVAFYEAYKGATLQDIYKEVQERYPHIRLSTNKGIVGQVLEALVGNPPDSDPSPDITSLGVELKVLPLRKNGKGLQPKERSKIKSLNYNTIVNQSWLNSDVRAKMQQLLFLMYEQPTGKTYKDWQSFIFHGPLLYELEEQNEVAVAHDWHKIQHKVQQGNGHLISEGDGLILGASTSGTGKLQSYGNGYQAKQRSYSLKHSYLKQFYAEHVSKKSYTSIVFPEEQTPGAFICDRLKAQLSGKTLKELSDTYDLPFSTSAKSGFKLLINRILKVGDQTAIRELEQYGIEIKTIPVGTNLKPWESMSFPKFSLVDLLSESWDNDGSDEATFKHNIDRTFIFLPVIKTKLNGTFLPWKTWKVGKPVIWKPTSAQLWAIQNEWEQVKQTVMQGIKTREVPFGSSTRQENNLLKSSESTYIHLRPHARDSNDIDRPYFEHTNGETRISWQSFWFNKAFIASLLIGTKF